jgi:NADH-quinone oxidoreductase subunit G
MEGTERQPPPALTPYFWAPGWNSIQSVNASQREIAGPLEGNPAGVRLIEPGTGTVDWSGLEPPEAFARRQDRWLVIPAHHVFGTEELSSRAPSVASVASQAAIALGAEDADRLGAREGDLLVLELAELRLELPLRVERALVPGVARLPIGLAGVPAVDLPAFATLSMEEEP